MTTATITTIAPTGIDLAVTRVATALLHWANTRTVRKARRRLPVTHEKMAMLIETERAIARTRIHPLPPR